MLGFYIFSAILGGGLLLVSFGDDASDAGGDASAGQDLDVSSDGGGSGHAGGVLFGFLKPRNLIFFLATFGITGSLLTWTGSGATTTAIASAAMGVGAMSLTHAIFTWLRRNESAVDVVGDSAIEGSIARVVLAVGPGTRGRIACVIAGREVHVVARLAPGAAEALEAGRAVLVVRMDDGEAEISPYANMD
ncbi:MAG: hypothetical protein O2973_08445 [Gemmatimonadetes bacterium]|nr:hypothetical protein [Gemmatimonadota bacterium]